MALRNNAIAISWQHKFLLVFFTLLMIPTFFVARNIFVVFTQTKDQNERKIKKLTFDNEPVDVISLKNSQRVLDLDKKFTQNIDWLKDLTIKFKNKSDKAITYFKVELDFPETKASGNIMAFPLSYGFSPAASVKNKKVDAIKPEEDFELTLDDKKLESLKEFIEKRHPLDSLSEIDLRIVFILFDDGTGWSSGSMMRPDPNNSNKFIPINQN